MPETSVKQGTSSMIFAHRGANREAAENTRSAFDKALSYPIDGMETDVQLSRDEVAVLWHDRFLNKLGMPDKRIDDFDFDELRAMNFAAHFSSESRESLMTLQEFVDAYQSRCHLLIEIKNRDWESPARHAIKIRQTLDLINPGSHDDTLVSSFNLNSLIQANQYRPAFPLVYNLDDDQTFSDAQHVLVNHAFLHGLCVPISLLDSAMVDLLRSRGKSIAVYTCNTPDEISWALQLKVDILITDVPRQALSLRGA